MATSRPPAGPTPLLSPQPTAFGKQGTFYGGAALNQPAGRAVVAYLQARASAAVTPQALRALPAFFVPFSPTIAWETYLARGKHAQWLVHGWPPATTTDTVNPATVSLTVVNRGASFQGHATDTTSFAGGRSDQEGEGLDHTINVAWLNGRWLVQDDAYMDDAAPRELAKGGAPRQMVDAALAEVEYGSQAGPREIATATGVVRAFVSLVDQGRCAAAQRLVRPGSRVSAQQLRREVVHVRVLKATFAAVPSNASIEVDATLRVQAPADSRWSSGIRLVCFTVTRAWIGRPWLIDDYCSVP